MMRRIRIDRRGVTLVELLVAMVVFSIVFGGAVSTFLTHNRAFNAGADRMSVLQNVRFALNMLESDLRTVGSGVADFQPFMVFAGADVFAYNANYTTNVANDVFAVYYDPDAPAGSVASMRQSNPITVPNSNFVYPDTTFQNSDAETIVFFFTPDSSTSRSDDYALFRKVNNDPPELVARNLKRTGSLPFFEYYSERTQSGGVRSVQKLTTAALPLRHSASVEGSPADTGTAAVIDSLRGVRVNLTATNGNTGTAEKTRTLSRLIRLPNAGVTVRKTCGDAPLPLTLVTATPGTDVNGDPFIRLAWSPSIDESSGEKDAVRYVIWRREAADLTWGDPYLSIPSGNPTYVYVDSAVQTGQTFRYRIAVQDCTPALSTNASAGPVVVP